MDILRDHPVQVFEIASEGLSQQRRDKALKRRETELKTPLVPDIDPDRPILGDPNAPVTIVEYSDFQCKYCAEGVALVDRLMADRPGQIRLVFKHTPSSELARHQALLFEAISLQSPEKAWDFYHRAFKLQKEIARDAQSVLPVLLRDLGVDLKRLAQDLSDAALQKRIQADMAEARRFGLDGTPMFLVNGVSIHGVVPEPAFEEVIDQVLKRDRAPSEEK